MKRNQSEKKCKIWRALISIHLLFSFLTYILYLIIFRSIKSTFFQIIEWYLLFTFIIVSAQNKELFLKASILIPCLHEQNQTGSCQNPVLNPLEFTRDPVLASNLVDLGFRETHFQDLDLYTPCVYTKRGFRS